MDQTLTPAGMDVLRWGRPPLALLPVALAQVLTDERLPEWLSELLDGQDTSLMALNASAWERLPHDEEFCERAARYVLDLVAEHARELEDVRIGRPLLHSHEPLGLGRWPTRALNAVLRSGIAADPFRLASLTLGQVLDIPHIGVRTALDIAALLELYPIDGDSDQNAPELAGGMAIAAMDVAPPILDEAARQELLIATQEEWAERVRADDPRFRDVAPPHTGSLSLLFDEVLNSPVGARAHAVAKALPAIRSRAQEIASEPIDFAVVRLLRSLGVPNRNAAIVVARLGLCEGGPRTLQEVGDEFSMTRERVRQIVDKVLDPIGATYLPQVGRAIQLLTARAPITVEDASRLLVEEGLATVPITPSALRAAADVLGYEVTFQIELGNGGAAYVLADGLPGTGPVFAVARREAGRVGVSNIEEIQAALEADGNDFSTDAVARVLRSSPKVEFLDEEWFWMPGIPADRNRLRNVTQRMISVTPRLDIPTIRQGVRRRYRFMQIDLVPPTDILAAFTPPTPSSWCIQMTPSELVSPSTTGKCSVIPIAPSSRSSESRPQG